VQCVLGKPLVAGLVLFCIVAAAVSCKGRATHSTGRKITVKYRYTPGAITVNNPQKESRCVVFRIEVSNLGYERVEFDRTSFSNEAEGKVLAPADPSRCSAAPAPVPAALKSGESWRGVIAFEQPIFALDSRVILKPGSVKGLPWGADPQIEYSISPD